MAPKTKPKNSAASRARVSSKSTVKTNQRTVGRSRPRPKASRSSSTSQPQSGRRTSAAADPYFNEDYDGRFGGLDDTGLSGSEASEMREAIRRSLADMPAAASTSRVLADSNVGIRHPVPYAGHGDDIIDLT